MASLVRPVPLLVALAAVLVAAAPAAEARSVSQVYFLKDAEITPGGPRLPLGDGELSLLPPPPLNTTDPAQNPPPRTRVIPVGVQEAVPVQFVANASANTGRVYGVAAVYLFLPQTPALQSATLNVTLVALPAEADVPPPLGGGGTVLAWAHVPLDYSNTTLPNATRLQPSNVTDPQSAAQHIANELLGYGITEVYKSGRIAILDDGVKDYLIDYTVDPDQRLALRLTLLNGTSPPPLPGAPIPIGAGQDIVYDFMLAPSLVVVPWYEPDPPRTVTPTTSRTTTSRAVTGTGTSATGSTSASEDTPGLPLALVALAAVGAAWATRRRL